MSEDDSNDPSSSPAESADALLADLSTSDIRTNIYEGGFKTWECSIDLASLLLSRGPRKDIDDLARVDSVIELGAGTALPTLTLFQHALQNSYSINFTLADYNLAVLRLVTLPNLLLTWARFRADPLIPTPDDDDAADPDAGAGDLDVTPDLLSLFLSDLSAAGITLTLVSGSWSPSPLFTSLIPPSSPDLGTLILAAETIYSPASTAAFVDVLMGILGRTKMAKCVVAAKRIYFGVGGSVDDLKMRCAERGAVAFEVENSGVQGMDRGVGRALVEVQMA